MQGRSVEILWGDEFTQFMGNRPCLLSAVFGDSNGFLCLPPPGIFFAGRQSLSLVLTRVLWPSAQTEEAITRFDFSFQGRGILPKNQQVSGGL
jgi:hypothetical protein